MTAQGSKIQIHCDITDSLRCRANYTYIDLNYENNYSSPFAPRHSGSFNLDYRLNDVVSLNLNGSGPQFCPGTYLEFLKPVVIFPLQFAGIRCYPVVGL